MTKPNKVGTTAKRSPAVSDSRRLSVEIKPKTTPKEVWPGALSFPMGSPQVRPRSAKPIGSRHLTENSRAAMAIYLREIGRIPLLTLEQEIEVAARIKNGDLEARALMINSNLRLVVTIAQRYANLGLPLLDVISEGNIGLIMAIDRFDPSKGAKLSTYAAWWIRQSIRRALSDQGKTIRLPFHYFNKMSKLSRVTFQMSEELGREPTDEELSEEIGIASRKVSQLRTTSISPASLDAPIADGDLAEFGEVVADEEARTPFELLREKDLHSEVSGLLKGLDDREKKLIFQRFGLDDGEQKTLQEVASELGLSRERVRQLESIALLKLRRAVSQERRGPFKTGFCGTTRRGDLSGRAALAA